MPPKLQAFNYRKHLFSPAVSWTCKVVVFACVVFLMLISVFLSCCISVQRHLQSPSEGCESGHRGLEDTDAILLRAPPPLLFVCLCFFFLLTAVWNFLFSAQGLYPPNHSHFTGFQKSYHFPTYMAKKSILLDCLTAVLISTPCSVCCWAMQRGRRAALICSEGQRGCACALALMLYVWSFCSLSTEVLPGLWPLVQQYWQDSALTEVLNPVCDRGNSVLTCWGIYIPPKTDSKLCLWGWLVLLSISSRYYPVLPD